MNTYNYILNGQSYAVTIESIENNIAKVNVNGVVYDVQLEHSVAAPAPRPVAPAPKPAAPASAPAAAAPAPATAAPAPAAPVTGGETVTSPLPGTIIDIKVAVGQEVKKGDTLIILEAMKMENSIDAESDGKVLAIKVVKGDTVKDGDALVVIG